MTDSLHPAQGQDQERRRQLLTEACERYAKQISSFHTLVEALKARNRELMEQVSTRVGAQRQLEADHERARILWGQRRGALESHVADLERANEALRNTLADLEAQENERALHALTRTPGKKDAMQALYEALQAKIDALVAEMQELRTLVQGKVSLSSALGLKQCPGCLKRSTGV